MMLGWRECALGGKPYTEQAQEFRRCGWLAKVFSPAAAEVEVVAEQCDLCPVPLFVEAVEAGHWFAEQLGARMETQSYGEIREAIRQNNIINAALAALPKQRAAKRESTPERGGEDT